ncbi:hypothetical protein PaeCFBP13512_22545 [Paenibacillus sp. CFBP13512]|uniref:hypothetical protein n=1 Tax=Paenibacillus sp. CFBP13512 TaxID=2184007 RepID=UPI0010BFA63E|nr:hypothetical protein [Paenibacillus sp. CFBP13512]TKJ83711.1 hypothetical protein PaeCFBP13512_22545 [Paenibacillus sp. CFBP13512]
MSNKWEAIPASQYPFLKDKVPTKRHWKGQKIYRDKKGNRYYHKDPLHGEIEVYDSFGNHIDVYTPEGYPHPTKGKVKGRDIKNEIK